MTRVRIGISTCPNDTFAFHGLLTGAVRPDALALEIELHDVEELNRRLHAGRLDAAKVSFHAALARAEDLWVLPSGSALGFGVGPVLLGRHGGPPPGAAGGRGGPPRVLCPGRWTTAALLWRLFHEADGAVEHVVFSEIVPALQQGRADLGVCIHEGRFTWEAAGLAFHEDLGLTWERATGAPLPLGGIAARRSLGRDAALRLQDAIRRSIEHGLAHRDACLPTMRRYAQELADDVLWAHVDLYVNARTLDLGEEGESALRALSERARAAGLIGPGAELVVLRGDPRLFHVCPWEAWLALAAGGPDAVHRPPSLAAEGFVHLSHAEQVEGTLAAHFAGAGRLALLELDPRRVGPALRLEPSRGGALFPHLYRPIERRDVLAAWPLEPARRHAPPRGALS